MNILDKIIQDKINDVARKKAEIPTKTLENMPFFTKNTHSLAGSLKMNPVGIIAEHKRKSPSKDIINDSLKVEEVVKSYAKNGASGISVLTDEKYFAGTLNDLQKTAKKVSTPLLRKEFIIDEYQILEAKAHGADAILLIAACLTQKELKQFAEFANSLNLEVLLEVHNEEELQKTLIENVQMLGVNNRNLKTFNVDLQTSKELSAKIPNGFVKVSESGISSPKAVIELQKLGFEGFLMGEHFMKTNQPGETLKKFIQQVNEQR